MKNFIDELLNEKNRFGTISVLLIVTSVLGGIAAGLFLNSALAMAIIVGVTMLVEALIIAVQPMKRIVFASAVACVLNLVFIISGLLM